jgi:hypothetical protein
MLSSSSEIVEVEVFKFNVVNRGVLEQKVEQRRYVICIKRDRMSTRERGNGRLGAN